MSNSESDAISEMSIESESPNFCIVREGGWFRVVPRGGLLFFYVVFMMFFYLVGFSSFMYFGKLVANLFLLASVPIVSVIAFLVRSFERHELNRGPWFEYESSSGLVRLPRAGEQFFPGQRAHLFFQRTRSAEDGSIITDLYIKMEDVSANDTYFVVGSYYGNQIKKLAQQISTETGIPFLAERGKKGRESFVVDND